jgi:hypothetical protein
LFITLTQVATRSSTTCCSMRRSRCVIPPPVHATMAAHVSATTKLDRTMSPLPSLGPPFEW